MPAITIDLPAGLYERLVREARILGKTPQIRICDILECEVAPPGALRPHTVASGLARLRAFLERVPPVRVLTTSGETDIRWWVKLAIDLRSRIAWHVVQELGFVLNGISVYERLPTAFMPVSPPPYLNGGPEEFLAWVVEARAPYLDAGLIADILEGRLPRPIENEESWLEAGK